MGVLRKMGKGGMTGFFGWIIVSFYIISMYSYASKIQGCTSSQTGINCSVFIKSFGCDPLSLHTDFPTLFPNMVNGKLPPGKPRDFIALEDNPGDYPGIISLSWKPPKDTSIEDVKGFYLSVSAVNGVDIGKSWCIVLVIADFLLTREDVDVLFTIPFYPVYGSSTYDFFLYSLPVIDPSIESSGNTDKAIYRKTTGRLLLSAMSSGDWTTNVTCGYVDENKIEVNFQDPPTSYGFKFFDAVLLYADKSGSESDIWIGEVTQNFTIYGKRDPGQFKLLLTPKDIISGLGQCICKNSQNFCVGYCKTSVCLLNITTTRTDVNVSCRYIDNSFVHISVYQPYESGDAPSYDTSVTKVDKNGTILKKWKNIEMTTLKNNEYRIFEKREPGMYEITLIPKQDIGESSDEESKDSSTMYKCRFYIKGISDGEDSSSSAFLLIMVTSVLFIAATSFITLACVCHRCKLMTNRKNTEGNRKTETKQQPIISRPPLSYEVGCWDEDINCCTDSLIELRSVESLMKLHDKHQTQCPMCDYKQSESGTMIYNECISLGGKSV